MLNLAREPLKFQRLLWPDVHFFKEQRQIIESVVENDETFVPAGNELGKDFVCAFIILWFFCTRRPARIVTTSVQESQLTDVLWGEIKRFIDTSKIKLPILHNHLLMRQIRNDGSIVPQAECRGIVAKAGEGLLGRHWARGPNDLPMCMAAFDEASAISDITYLSSDTWTHRKIVIGNCFPTTNFFYTGVKQGDLRSPKDDKSYWRKIIKIKATQSPNVRRGLEQEKRGIEPDNKIIVPGVVSYADYKKRRVTWDEQMQSVGLDAEWWEGRETRLIPKEWLERAMKLPKPSIKNTKVAMGVDSAEGNDSSTWCIATSGGVLDLIAEKTFDTTIIVAKTKLLMRQYKIGAQNVFFDRGGGGKQHCDRLRKDGHPVVSVGFGEAATPPRRYGRTPVKQKTKDKEQTYIYKNRRAELYGTLRMLLDPVGDHNWHIPEKVLYEKRSDGGATLYEQLTMLPLLYDEEGRLYLPPKRKKPNSTIQSLIELLGCSPDEADALALVAYGLMQKTQRTTGGFF